MDKKLPQLRWYADNQMPIFPLQWIAVEKCSCGDEACKSAGKHPLTANGFLAACCDMERIAAWHAKFPEANWGMRTGSRESGGAGVVVIDIDPRHGGTEAWEMLRDQNPDLIETITVKTGGGGYHYWFAYPDGLQISSKAEVIGPGIDHRANNGYVVVPPSRTLQDYMFQVAPGDTGLQSLPGWILERLIGDFTSINRRNGRIQRSIPVGKRHQAMVSIGAAMRRVGLEGDEIANALTAVSEKRFEVLDTDTQSEIDGVVEWLERKPKGYSPSDLGNAERFVDQYGQDTRYCHKWGSWLVWDGMRWKADESEMVVKLAHQMVKQIYAEAADQNDEKIRAELGKHALRSESRFRIDNLLQGAKPYLSIAPEHLNQHAMLLNCRNGIINLTTGELLPHERKYLLTKLIDADFDPHADCPRWEQFIQMITGGDTGLMLFLQLAVGYTLTGLTDEHCLFFLHGSGKNGKSTFVETLRKLFGDYSQRTVIDALLQSRDGNGAAASPYVAQLAGARLVVASEIPEGRRINEALIKDLTGGDALTARYLFQNPFTFDPSHKLWVYGNHKPKVTGTDEGFWRRMRVIPFNVTIPEEARRPMSEVLADFEAELSGILTWAATGCQMWLYNRLAMVPAVEEATKTYRTEQDLVQQFIDEKCELLPSYLEKKADIYQAWREWCKDNGEEGAMNRSKRWLTQQLLTRGTENGGQGDLSLKGIKLKK